MTEIVVLSDSNDSDLFVESNNKPDNIKDSNKKRHSFNDSNSSDFEFPEIQFYHTVNNAVESENISKIYSPVFSTPVSLQANNKYIASNKSSKQCNVEESLYNFTNSSDFTKDTNKEKDIKKQKRSKSIGKKSKSQVIEERLKKREQLMRERALNIITAKKSKNLKPGDCMKFVEVVLDKNIENFVLIMDIINILIDANLQYSISTEMISNSITWKRSIENNYVNEANEICTIKDIEKVNQMLIIWNWDEAVTKVADNSFCTSIFSIKSLLPNYKLILIIFGIEDYFIHRKQEKDVGRNEAKSKVQKAHTKTNHKFKSFPEISKRQLETYLNEIQIIAGCSSKLINNTQELALMIYQCTKAIAEIPHKLEKNKNLTNKFDWYVMGDNRNTVKVDKNGNGLKRLWQQQLCQFNLSSLEVANAICSVYPSPADLIEAYITCDDNDGINLLKDIPIRRAAGPLTTIRKIGPELSKKIFLMFTSKNGDNILI